MHINIKIIITDLDGTLLPSNGKISIEDYRFLEQLQQKKIIRVIATGRNLYSALSFLPSDFPIDYLIFSSGAGIMKWDNKQLIYTKKIEHDKVAELSEILIQHQVDFMILEPIPKNHQFWYYRTDSTNADFNRRLNHYKQFATPIGNIADTNRDACQVLAILPNQIDWFEELSSKFSGIKIIRATSPIDKESIWMEFFPENVSKGHACYWLCNQLNLSPEMAATIGNDYNDIDMLNWSKYSFVVAEAPFELKQKYTVINQIAEIAINIKCN